MNMPTDIENIEEYWDITRPQRSAVTPATPSESMTVEEVLKAIKKFNKEVLCMGLAIMVNHGDVSSPTIVAESAKEFERLKKGTLVQLTLLTGVPLNILIQCNESRTSVRARSLDEREINFFPDWTLIPSGQVEEARTRRQVASIHTCSSCGRTGTIRQPLVDSMCLSCRQSQFIRRRRLLGD
jgi:hypothetical protein